MTKLHEVLAVEGTAERTARQLVSESQRTFGKENLFSGETKILSMFSDEDKELETQEHRVLESTVMENLEYLAGPLAEYYDLTAQKDDANQQATADLVLEDGTVLGQNLPATFLLGMETKLGSLRDMYLAIPTLEPGIDWVKDELNRAGVYRTNHDVVSFKTRKDTEFKVAHEPTKEHPAIVHPVDVTVNVGRFNTRKYSGKLSPLEKAQILTRLDIMIKAVRRARARANDQEVNTKLKIGRKILDFIHLGK